MPDIPTSPGFDEIVVGFEDETENIIEKLIRGPKELDVVSITGMAGLGKTTLARKVFQHKHVIDRFDLRAWCCVSQEYDKSGVFYDIFSQVTGSKGEDATDEVLLEILMKKCQDNRNWDDILEALRISLIGKHKLYVLLKEKANEALEEKRNDRLYMDLKEEFEGPSSRDDSTESLYKSIVEDDASESLYKSTIEMSEIGIKSLTQMIEDLGSRETMYENVIQMSEDDKSWKKISDALRGSILEKCKNTEKWSDIAKPLYECLMATLEGYYNPRGNATEMHEGFEMWEGITGMIRDSKIVGKKDVKRTDDEVQKVFESLVDLAQALLGNINKKCHMLETIFKCVNDVVETFLLCLHKKCRESWNENIAEKLRKRLMGNRYLIVLDDVWRTEAWDELSRAFPSGTEGSRTVLTSREYDVGKYARSGAEPHTLRFFTTEESQDLLQLRLSKDNLSPPGLKEFGRQIAEKCGGVPLVVILVAGILRKKFEEKNFSWKEFLQSLSSHIREDESRSMDVIALSYRLLPEHLKPCLLYFGAFPEDQEISVSSLIQLWMAEGFVKQIDGKRLEDEAEDYLNHLIGSNLVIVSTRGYDGSVRTCRVHDLIGSFCLSKSKKEKFLMQADNEAGSFPELGCAYDRFCLHEWGHTLNSPIPLNPSLGTLLCFSSHTPKLQKLSLSTRLSDPSSGSWAASTFKFVRVLDLESVAVGKLFLSEVDSLCCLRYLSLCIIGRGSVPKPSLCHLDHLETFKVKTGCRDLHLPFMIWNLGCLRHLHIDHYCYKCRYFRSAIDIPLEPLNLQTISIPVLSSSPSEECLLRKLPHLRKLRCRFSASRDGDHYRFPELRFLDQLESLEAFYIVRRPDPPVHYRAFNFPQSLKQLTLHKFCLPWDSISSIATLPRLESLELFETFEGDQWDVEEGNFRKLKFLRLCESRVVRWNATADSFPVLERLVLVNCRHLKEVPSSFQDIITLQVIEVDRCNSSVAQSVNQIQEWMQELGNYNLTVRILRSYFEL